MRVVIAFLLCIPFFYFASYLMSDYGMSLGAILFTFLLILFGHSLLTVFMYKEESE